MRNHHKIATIEDLARYAVIFKNERFRPYREWFAPLDGSPCYYVYRLWGDHQTLEITAELYEELDKIWTRRSLWRGSSVTVPSQSLTLRGALKRLGAMDIFAEAQTKYERELLEVKKANQKARIKSAFENLAQAISDADDLDLTYVADEIIKLAESVGMELK